jgi:hypothetical protein
MGTFTNFVLSGLCSLAVLGIGCLFLRYRGADTLTFMTWIKIWAILVDWIVAIAASLLLSVLFPGPDDKGISNMINSVAGAITTFHMR